DLSLKAEIEQPEDLISAYSALDSESGNLHIILVNKVKEVQQFEVLIEWEGFESTGRGAMYTYSFWNAKDQDEDPGIVGGDTQMGQTQQIVQLPGYSIVHMILEPVPELDQERG
ncbi:MAG: hypothetical protein AAGD96_36380, partial [Chloroflexota bacterium]